MKITLSQTIRWTSVWLLYLLCGAQPGLTAVRLPQVISDHMILQRDTAAPIWGWADAGERVTVTFAGQSKTATADANGKWLVKLDAMPANPEARELTVSGRDSIVKIADVLVGDVWLVGGQSNMGSPLNSAHNAAKILPVAEQGWPWLREAQLLTLQVPHTGMAITIDVGDPNNVHPADKLDVGRRLALLARRMVYGENVVASGPLYRDVTIEPNGRIRLRFTETGGGLTLGQQPWRAPDVAPFPKDKLIGFYLAGADKKWVEADASIEGDSVVVFSAAAPNPVAVRYGWANSPRCNLYNKEGLPASPFRTDDWNK